MTGQLIYRRDFRTEPLSIVDGKADRPWHTWGDANIEQDDQRGLRLWCRNGTDCGAMLDMPFPNALWLVRSRITGPTDRLSTKVCNLLWPKQPPDHSVSIWPPELDFNESADRARSNQTLHYGTREENFMHHTTFIVDQTKWHTWGVQVAPGRIDYLCDGAVQASVTKDVPASVGYDGLGWNLHLRTETKGRPDVTELDVRWIEIRGLEAA